MRKAITTTTGLTIKIVIMLILFFTSCKESSLEELKTYYQNGNIKSIEYLNKKGKKETASRYYTEDGILSHITTFKNGTPIKVLHFYSDGKLHYSSELMQNDTIKALSYFKNGKIKTVGNLIDTIKIGWWKEYRYDGTIGAAYEYLNNNGKQYLNQLKVYTKNGTLNENESSFFTLSLPDTLQIGKNAGSIKYYSIPNKNSERYLYIIIDNEYEGGIIKKDTFFITNNENNRFGIYAYKPGLLKVKGTILDRELYEKKVGKDSYELEFKDGYKYFEKEVYVKD
ncbi:hypothetical protein [Flavobacterium kingsejongi]|uniref:Uncharacterized protein n=1 Tax=Flavobacterium kingsejongi TaxID=1678728 RepID=A0A2S1LRA5_9FLAO|nr:hypothetical protein [Flavobacterium kingsejongi]AWG26259.1 hypothetical protein FK004_13980 [Flavobacterium kingsejongi]